MTTAQQVYGNSGHRCVLGLDIADGIQVDSSYMDTPLYKDKPVKNSFNKYKLTNLKDLHGNMDMLVDHIIRDGYKITDNCLYSALTQGPTGIKYTVRYIRIKNYEYRMYRSRITKQIIEE